MLVVQVHRVSQTAQGQTDSRRSHLVTSDIFAGSEELAHIRAAARGALCAPTAVLVSTLALAATAAPANLLLPPIVGAPSKASCYVALVGPPGAGKSVAQGIARQLVPDAPALGLGSGEAVFKIFLEPGTQDENGQKGPMQLVSRPTALGIYDEGEHLLSSMARQGSTLGATLRSAWVGASISSVIAGAAQDARQLPAFRYQLSLLIGLQPGLCGPLLQDQSGMTDRLVFAEVTDGTLDETDPIVTPLPMLTLDREDFDPIQIGGLNFPSMKADSSIESAIRVDRVRRVRGEHTSQPFDGHSMLSRLKVASALALLHRRPTIEIIDWEIAELIEEGSARCRDRLIEQAAETQRSTAVEQGELSAVRSEAFDTAYVRKVCDRIDHLIAKGKTRRFQIDRDLSPKQRQYADQAIGALLDEGRISVDFETEAYRPSKVGHQPTNPNEING